MRHPLIEAVDAKTQPAVKTSFRVGDTVEVHVKIVEGDKQRIQVFSGVVISRRGQGIGKTFIVRRIVAGEGVERIFPLRSPAIVKVEVVRSGHTRRGKLYYLRDRVGKATRLRERSRTVAADEQMVADPPAASADDPQPEADDPVQNQPAPKPAAKA